MLAEVALGTSADQPIEESAAIDEPVQARRGARIVAMALYILALAAYSKLVGLPADIVQVFAWMWLGIVAWNIHAPRSTLVFFRDWWPALAVLEVYVYSRGITAHLGLAVHVTEPIRLDEWLGGGELPTQRLQATLCGAPCHYSLEPHWYDGVLTSVYYTHFIAAPLTALVLWLRDRHGWLSFMRRYVSLYIAGLFFYITYPMAPPWMASDDGYLSGQEVSRITSRGWEVIGLEHFQQWLSRLGNQVAAMPSLHAATAVLVALYGVSRLRSRWRYLLLGYPLAMSFMLVYYGEHYVVDIVAGAVLAVLIMWGCSNWERGGLTRRVPVAANAAVLGRPGDPDHPDRAASPQLARLRRLPPLVVPCVLLALSAVGVLGSWYAAIPALLIVGGFVAWVTRSRAATADVADEAAQRSRLFALAALGPVAVLLAWQVAGLL
jgi:hypothetical protein